MTDTTAEFSTCYADMYKRLADAAMIDDFKKAVALRHCEDILNLTDDDVTKYETLPELCERAMLPFGIMPGDKYTGQLMRDGEIISIFNTRQNGEVVRCIPIPAGYRP